jgi:hypothetical protein
LDKHPFALSADWIFYLLKISYLMECIYYLQTAGIHMQLYSTSIQNFRIIRSDMRSLFFVTPLNVNKLKFMLPACTAPQTSASSSPMNENRMLVVLPDVDDDQYIDTNNALSSIKMQ